MRGRSAGRLAVGGLFLTIALGVVGVASGMVARVSPVNRAGDNATVRSIGESEDTSIRDVDDGTPGVVVFPGNRSVDELEFGNPAASLSADSQLTDEMRRLAAALPGKPVLTSFVSGPNVAGAYHEEAQFLTEFGESITVWWQVLNASGPVELVQAGDAVEETADGGQLIFHTGPNFTQGLIVGDGFLASIVAGPEANNPQNRPAYPVDWIAPIALEIYTALAG
ncbi:MAG: hypothetical protein R2823_03720 [Acidimicrobiia bacterium]